MGRWHGGDRVMNRQAQMTTRSVMEGAEGDQDDPPPGFAEI